MPMTFQGRAIGAPTRLPPISTVGSLSFSRPFNFATPPLSKKAPSKSDTWAETSATFPSPSMTAGFSLPGSPIRSSFMKYSEEPAIIAMEYPGVEILTTPLYTPPLMAFDIVSLFKQRNGENYKLHAKYINPAWAKVTQLIGYDKVWARAEGQYLWDADGQRTLDCVSGFCVSNIGHNHPVVRKALQDLLGETFPNLIQLDCSLLPGLLAEALVKRIPWLGMVYFGTSGREAMEAAIKFARASTGRQRILYADHSYHGVSYGALSVTGHAMWR